MAPRGASIKINGRLRHLWRAVHQNGNVWVSRPGPDAGVTAAA
ncbi:hypothetical protein [Streptomyces prasinus]